ncbi:Hypothetical protein A7982_04755 [Minicystis rosea]|nr:Hypothetical protein A7982_04755 [Minicystis rosea]
MARRLDVILRALPDSELNALIGRMGIRVDPGKRIDTPSQAARALVGIPDVRDTSRLSASSRELLHRIAEAGGSLIVPSLPAGLEPLLARGVVFGRRIDHGIELVLPTAFLLQLKSWEGEDPRALRALLAQAPFETLSAIAGHYLGRPANPPIALSLEPAWEVLSDPDRLQEELEKVPPVERRLLESIEAVGGEVDTQELLDLEREPLRLRGAGGVTATRRGAGFSLERRAFLIPIHPNRHVVPTEVANIVGADRRRMRETRRAQIRSFVLEEDHAPRRARFASDPAFLAVAMAFCVREPGSEVRAGVGTPRSLLLKLAQRFGRDVETIALVAALSRAVGLWDPTAASPATPPGVLAMYELSQILFTTWRRGGAWDEARAEREVLRVAESNRDASPIGALREMVIDALTDLGEGRWVPWHSLEGYLAADERVPGIERLLRRWAERAAVDVPDVLTVTRRVALETLPALGIIDLGGSAEEIAAGAPTVRLTPRGRALLSGLRPTIDPTPSKFIDTQALRVGQSARIAHVLGIAPFAELGRVGAELDLLLTPQALARALSAGLESDSVRTRIEQIAPLPDTISRLLVQASTVIGRGQLVGASGFLWVDDPEVRELLRTRRPASEVFVDPSPPGGLLIQPDIEPERVVRRCRSLGVEVEVETGVLRVKSLTPMPSRAATPPSRPNSSTPPPPGVSRNTPAEGIPRQRKTPPPLKR